MESNNTKAKDFLRSLIKGENKVTRKALLAAILLGCLISFQGFIYIGALYHAENTVHMLNNDTFSSLYWAGKLKGEAKDQRIAIILCLISKTKNEMESYQKKVDEREIKMKIIREQYPILDERARNAIKISAEKQEKFYSAWKNIKALKENNKEKEAWDVYNGKLMEATLERRKVEDYLAAISQERGQQYTKSIIKKVAETRKIGWAVTFFCLSIGIGIFLFFAYYAHKDNIEIEKEKNKANIKAAEADNANKSKSHFLASMSHEIRTPLNAILGITELLEHDYQHINIEDCLKTIHSSGDTLLSLINNILDFSKIESGNVELENKPTDIIKCSQDALNIISSMAMEKGLDATLVINPDEHMPKIIYGDELRLKQVLLNLLMNSIKFTDKGSVILTIKCTGDKLNFEIKDTGVGMWKDQQEELFKPFARSGKTNSRYVGSGLGLSIAQKLVKLMKGDITVESLIGVGSTFTVSIPFTEAEEEYYKEIEKKSSLTKQESPKKETLLADPKIKILTVDDNEINQKVIKLTLKRLGFKNISEAKNGLEAVKKVEKESFDIIFMDMQMPVMDGIEASKIILENHRDNNKPQIIALTANAIKEDIENCLSTGIDDYLLKPINRELLTNAINNAYERSIKDN